MINSRKAAGLREIIYAVAIVLVSGLAGALVASSARAIPSRSSPTQSSLAQSSDSERTIWEMEHAYWRHVQDNDLTSYRKQWHKNFLGWPSVSAKPVQKDHITDWITSETSKGLTFKLVEFKPAAIQVTGDVAETCYWITDKWTDKNGEGIPVTTRVTHTWIKNGSDWQIIGGMSSRED
jgi:ketosteroid isomerase-like protein